MSDFGRELIESAHEALAIAEGRAEPVGMYVPPSVDVAAIRRKLGLTQAAFASRFGVPIGTLRDWEQGRRAPEGPARSLLMVIDREPKAVERALASA